MYYNTSGVYFSDKEYRRGVNLSKNFQARTSEETTELYVLIKEAVLSAQDPQNLNADESLAFVIFIFDPLIRKVASKIYPHIKDYEEFDLFTDNPGYFFCITCIQPE